MAGRTFTPYAMIDEGRQLPQHPASAGLWAGGPNSRVGAGLDLTTGNRPGAWPHWLRLE